ncbi:MAG: phasin family protein [Anaerolineae bacterium]
MTKQTNTPKFDKLRDTVECNPLYKQAHKMMLAGAGAMFTLQDEAETLFERLVERGEKVEKEGRKTFKTVAKRPQKKFDRLGERFNRRFDKVLARLNIPTRSDVKTLNAKITALTKKVDDLKKAQA